MNEENFLFESIKVSKSAKQNFTKIHWEKTDQFTHVFCCFTRKSQQDATFFRTSKQSRKNGNKKCLKRI